MKKRGYHQQAIKRHYGGELAGLAHARRVFASADCAARGLARPTVAAALMPSSARRLNRKCGMRL
jgi:hypothetical protein